MQLCCPPCTSASPLPTVLMPVADRHTPRWGVRRGTESCESSSIDSSLLDSHRRLACILRPQILFLLAYAVVGFLRAYYCLGLICCRCHLSRLTSSSSLASIIFPRAVLRLSFVRPSLHDMSRTYSYLLLDDLCSLCSIHPPIHPFVFSITTIHHDYQAHFPLPDSLHHPPRHRLLSFL